MRTQCIRRFRYFFSKNARNRNIFPTRTILNIITGLGSKKMIKEGTETMTKEMNMRKEMSMININKGYK
jgi:hypothetical protein